MQKRNLRLPFMEVFDSPTADKLPAPGIEHTRAAGAGTAERPISRIEPPRRWLRAARSQTPGEDRQRSVTWLTALYRPAAPNDQRKADRCCGFPENSAAARIRPGDVQPERISIRGVVDGWHARMNTSAITRNRREFL